MVLVSIRGDLEVNEVKLKHALHANELRLASDEEVAAAAAKLLEKKVDILITHGCPLGIADLTPIGTRGGQRCFTEAFKLVNPKLYICGHLHHKSSYQTQDGELVVNIGFTKEGDYAVFNFENESFEFESKVI